MTKRAEEERMEDLGQQGDEEKKARKEREGWRKEDAHLLLPRPKNTETTAHPGPACSLEYACACTLACVAVSIFFGQGHSSA